MPSKTSCNWCFTINNPESNDLAVWPDIRFRVYQRERGAEGTEHLQGYVVFEKYRSLFALKKIDARAHWEMRRGTHEGAKAYCQKTETRVDGPWTMGEDFKSRGGVGEEKRKKLDEVAGAILGGKRMRQVVLDEPGLFVRFSKGLQAVKAASLVPRDRNLETKTKVFVGPTGCGKSRTAHDLYPNAFFQDGSKWWDGYEGQEVVVIDEFYGQMPYNLLLKLLDRYPMRVETKGGYIEMCAHTFIITTNEDPSNWYHLTHDWYPALARRLEVVRGQSMEDFRQDLAEALAPAIVAAAEAAPIDLRAEGELPLIVECPYRDVHGEVPTQPFGEWWAGV